MKHSAILPIGMTCVLGLGCVALETDGSPDETARAAGSLDLAGNLEDESLEAGEQSPLASEPVDQPSYFAYRSCSSDYNCHPSCMCEQGVCVPGQFGPSPSQEFCNQPPSRSCQSSSDCRSGCACLGGTCTSTGTADDCHLPLLDEYENDDNAGSASSYPGATQLHNFHRNGDADWVLVHFDSAGTVNFQTSGSIVADTVLRVYSYQNGGPGNLVGYNDDICGVWYSSYCQGSRVTLSVPANSLYFVQITNAAYVHYNEYDSSYPSYQLTISY